MKLKKLSMIAISGIITVSTLALAGCSSPQNTPKQAKEAIMKITPEVAANYSAYISKHRPPQNLNCLYPNMKQMIGKPAGITQADYEKMQKTCAPYYQELSKYLATQGISGVTKSILLDANVQQVIQTQKNQFELNKVS